MCIHIRTYKIHSYIRSVCLVVEPYVLRRKRISLAHKHKENIILTLNKYHSVLYIVLLQHTFHIRFSLANIKKYTPSCEHCQIILLS